MKKLLLLIISAIVIFGCQKEIEREIGSTDVDTLAESVAAAEQRFGHKLWIIQDCAHSFAARWNRRSVVAAGDVALFGLNVSKMITSVFGGALTTDDSSRITPSTSSSMATGCSAGSGCVAFSASGQSPGSTGSHGGSFVLADASHGGSQAVEGKVR